METLPITHELKVAPEHYRDLADGKKNYEVRFNDRNFKVGDVLMLREFDNGQYTGCANLMFNVVHVLRDFPGLKEGWVALGLGPTRNAWREAVTDLCAVSWVSWDEADPRKAVMDLCRLKTSIALDPAVSREARALMGRGIEAFDLFDLMRVRRLGLTPEKEAGWNVSTYNDEGEEVPLASGKNPVQAMRNADAILKNKNAEEQF